MLQLVAVPVNYGMLSYVSSISRNISATRRSPRQLWNALLPMEMWMIVVYMMSQSPSIMECSPTQTKIVIL